MTPELQKTEADNCDAQSGLSPAPCSAYQVNEIVTVKAWWYPDNRNIKCRIMELSKAFPGKYYTVQPLEGNTHSRWVEANLINTPNVQAEPCGRQQPKP